MKRLTRQQHRSHSGLQADAGPAFRRLPGTPDPMIFNDRPRPDTRYIVGGLIKPLSSVLLAIALMFSLSANAVGEGMGAQHKVVIQVSTDDPRTQAIALNNAVNLQKALGMDNVEVEIVAYGPGLSLLTRNSKQAKRVESLAMQDITFSACANTMKKIEMKKGKKPVLLDGVKVVPAGVLRIMKLQEQGYAYIRP